MATPFPSLPPSPLTDASPSSATTPNTKPRPFALSNLAFANKAALSPAVTSPRLLSPSIEKALEEQEIREERRRKSSSESRSGTSTPRIASAAASNRAEDGFTQDAEEMTERRFFTSHSRQSSEASSPAYDEEPKLQYADEVEDVEEAQAEDEQEEMLEAESTVEVAPEVKAEVVRAASDSLLSAPTLSRTASNLSSVSAASSRSSSSFRARPAPTSQPSIQPRLTKAAALRLGVSLPPPIPRRNPSEASTTSEWSATVSRVVAVPKSLAAPAIAPRTTKAAALRAGQDVGSSSQTPRPTKRQSISTSERAAMDRLARRHSIQVPSLAATPVVEVRMSRAAMLRQGKDLPPITPRLARQASTTSVDDGRSSTTTTTSKRASVSASLKSLREPSVAPRSTRASALRTSTAGPSESPSISRSRPPVVGAEARAKTPMDFDGVPGHKRRESIPVKATQPPKVEVRMSKAARLRNGIVEEETNSAAMRRAKTEPSTMSYEGVPGHCRRDNIAVASSKPPSITPRLNRAVLLRQSSDDARSTSPSTLRRPATSLATLTVPASKSTSTLRAPSPLSPRPKISVKSSAAPTIAPRLNKAAELRAAKKVTEQQGAKSPAQAAARPGLLGKVTGAARPATSMGLALRETTNSPSRK